MAGTLLHVTLADAALTRLSDDLRRRLVAHPDDYHLGAVIFDLPYFEHLVYRAFQLFVTGELGYHTFGHLLHLRAPNLFCRLLLENAASPAEAAVALGSLTHIAVDLAFHPFIEQEIMATADGTVDLNRLHKRIEDGLDYSVHMHLLGHPGIGTAYVSKMLDLRPRSAFERLFRAAALGVHGTAPSPRKIRAWLASLRLFGRAHRFAGLPWVHTAATPDPALDETAVVLANRAMDTAATYLEIGAAFLEKTIDDAEFADRVPSRNLINGLDAEGPRSPGISELTSTFHVHQWKKHRSE